MANLADRRLHCEAPRRKPRREAAALAGLAFDLEPRFVARERVLRDGEAEPRATGLARAAAIDAIKALGEPRNVLRFDADAGVFDAEARAIGRFLPGKGHSSAEGRVTDGVRYQIAERARELAFDAEQIGFAFLLEHDRVPSAGQRFGIALQPPDERAHGHARLG